MRWNAESAFGIALFSTVASIILIELVIMEIRGVSCQYFKKIKHQLALNGLIS